MIKFVNLDNGNVYDGSMPYVHYFDGELSTDLIYTLRLCIISDLSTLNISIENNDVFKLLDLTYFENMSKFDIEHTDIINDVKYIDIKKYQTLFIDAMKGQSYNNKEYYLYPIYFIANSNTSGEYTAQFNINDNVYSIGANFYSENEILKINLRNFGLEIPESILKSIYPVNIREDKLDYITLNRKWKELLSNYWDVIANKGSYKSLENSLKWFEYGDLVKIKELWKHDDFGKTIYDSRDIDSVSNLYENFLRSHFKTTYLSLHMALLNIKKNNGLTEYDEEKNPKLQFISSIWSVHDLMLKMCMLGNFFETYFMPIHLDLIQSTIEDIVFTNTIKIINSARLNYEDSFNSFGDIKCDLQNDSVFYLNNVSVLVGRNTKISHKVYPMHKITGLINFDNKNPLIFDNEELYRNLYYDVEDYEQLLEKDPNIDKMTYTNTSYPFGVEEETDKVQSDVDERTFWSQNYTGPGVIVKFNCSLVLDADDYIKKETVSYIPDNNIDGKWMTFISNSIFSDRRLDDNGNKTLILDIPFNILCREARKYDIRIQFETAGGLIFAKNISFDVKEPGCNHLTLYKLEHKPYPSYIGFEYFERSEINDLSFGRIPNLPLTNDSYCNLFVPTTKNDIESKDWRGVCLNNILILKSDKVWAGAEYNGNDDILRELLELRYFIYTKKISTNIIYTICISRIFYYRPNDQILLRIKQNKIDIYRNDYGFFHEFHRLKEFGGTKLEDFVITDKDTLCVSPNFKYGANIDEYEWVFLNATTGEIIKLPVSSKMPIISHTDKKLLNPGYYNIIFKYSLINDKTIHTIRWDSAFIKK